MLELVKYIAQSLVDKPEEVKLKQTETENNRDRALCGVR